MMKWFFFVKAFYYTILAWPKQITFWDNVRVWMIWKKKTNCPEANNKIIKHGPIKIIFNLFAFLFRFSVLTIFFFFCFLSNFLLLILMLFRLCFWYSWVFFIDFAFHYYFYLFTTYITIQYILAKGVYPLYPCSYGFYDTISSFRFSWRIFLLKKLISLRCLSVCPFFFFEFLSVCMPVCRSVCLYVGLSI